MLANKIRSRTYKYTTFKGIDVEPRENQRDSDKKIFNHENLHKF